MTTKADDVLVLIRERIKRLREILDHGGPPTPQKLSVGIQEGPSDVSQIPILLSDSSDDEEEGGCKEESKEDRASFIIIESDDEGNVEEDGGSTIGSPSRKRTKIEWAEIKGEEEILEQPQSQPHYESVVLEPVHLEPVVLEPVHLEPVQQAVDESSEDTNMKTRLITYRRKARKMLPLELFQEDESHGTDEHSAADKYSVEKDDEKGEVLESEDPLLTERQGSHSPETSTSEEKLHLTMGDLENELDVYKSDGLEDLWQDMELAKDFSKRVSDSPPTPQQNDDECEHQCILKDHLGLVCRICGSIEKPIEKMIDYQFYKRNRNKTYPSESRDDRAAKSTFLSEYQRPEEYLRDAEIYVHPLHGKSMKEHQLEGFCFLAKNLLSDKPGGCILAHAPGSGKTFMLISFIYSFLAKCPIAKILVVLPKGIVPSWKKEFQKWKIDTEGIPLHDFYSTKADKRDLQLEVLKQWEKGRSILFLSYQQFSIIVSNAICDDKISAACTDSLLKAPNLLIIDEGHTPRNEDTNVLQSLSKVQTPLKVVLSGTLFQNRVSEVFNILNLVRPKFMKTSSSQNIKTRISTRVRTSHILRKCKTSDKIFYDAVEETLQNDDDFDRKVKVIQDLREMTQNVLHYYKGDFLEELPGIVDLTVYLNITEKQKSVDETVRHYDQMKRQSVCASIYLHPQLKEASEAGENGLHMIDDIVKTLDIEEGVKTNFFINILSMSDSAGEKLLVFSQYIPPMKFLEKLLTRTKGWRIGKEMFMISGKSTSEQREGSMEQFNKSPIAKVLFGSIKACGEGISLVGASRVLILDVHMNPSVSRQAIGRAYRPDQTKKVYVYRLIAADTVEEENHKISCRKELISKLWFEWKTGNDERDFTLKTVGLDECEDVFLENPSLAKDIKILYRRYF